MATRQNYRARASTDATVFRCFNVVMVKLNVKPVLFIIDAVSYDIVSKFYISFAPLVEKEAVVRNVITGRKFGIIK